MTTGGEISDLQVTSVLWQDCSMRKTCRNASWSLHGLAWDNTGRYWN